MAHDSPHGLPIDLLDEEPSERAAPPVTAEGVLSILGRLAFIALGAALTLAGLLAGINH